MDSPIIQPQQIVTDLKCVSDIAFLPDRTMIYLQRDLGLLNIQKQIGARNTVAVPCETTFGDGGLLGVAIDPEFINSRYIYLSLTQHYNDTYTKNGNAVVRYTLNTDLTISNPVTIVEWDANEEQNGGAIKFGPDNLLYVATGCAMLSSNAQSLVSNNGKVLRLNRDGTKAVNPFGSKVFSYGYQNPQGLCFQGPRLWVTDQEKITIVRSGMNLGYGTSSSIDIYGNIVSSVTLQADLNETWGTTGIAFANSSLYVGLLGKTTVRGMGAQALAKCVVAGAEIISKTNLYPGTYGRVRAVTAAPDGLYFGTSNHDGVGYPFVDSIWKVSP